MSCTIRNNAETTCLSNFTDWNHFVLSWDHPLSRKDNTYSNLSLNHFSCIDHFIVTNNIFDCITANMVISEVTNPSNHDAMLVAFNFNITVKAIT